MQLEWLSADGSCECRVVDIAYNRVLRAASIQHAHQLAFRLDLCAVYSAWQCTYTVQLETHASPPARCGGRLLMRLMISCSSDDKAAALTCRSARYLAWYGTSMKSKVRLLYTKLMMGTRWTAQLTTATRSPFCTLWPCDLDLWPLTFWTNINWWVRYSDGQFLCQVSWLYFPAISVLSCKHTHTHTHIDRQTTQSHTQTRPIAILTIYWR